MLKQVSYSYTQICKGCVITYRDWGTTAGSNGVYNPFYVSLTNYLQSNAKIK